MTIRIFVSSPGDVSEERGLAQQVLERLRLEFAGTVAVDAYFWEHEPLTAGLGFQDQIALPSEHDLVITILWSRIGTRLHPRFAPEAGRESPTGTEFEVEDALRSWRQFHRPDLLMFVCTAPVIGDLRAVETRSRIEQQQGVEEFIRRVVIEHPDIGLAAHHPYKAPWDFAEQLEMKVRKWLERRVGESLTHGAAWHEAPYRGLAVFESRHQLIFCGRRRAISEVLARLKSLSERMAAWTARRSAMENGPASANGESSDEPRMFLLVQGMSGNGKSSLIRAGVLPLLNVGAVEGVGAWRRAIVKPSDTNGNVFLGLARALTQDANDARERALPELLKAGQTVEELAQDLKRHPSGALSRIKGALADIAERSQLQAGQVRLVVFVDQLEELFTDTRKGDADRIGLVTALDSLASGHQAWVIATLRSDFAHRCEELPLLEALRDQGRRVWELGKPDTGSLIEMIEEPARLAGLRFEEREGQRLSQRILEDAQGNAEALPLLEFVLEQLYERRSDRGLLTHAAYESLGMLEGALVKAAEDAVAAAIRNAAEGDKAFVRVMRELVGIDESGARTRRRVQQPQFASGSTERVLIEALVSARLLSADSDEDGTPTVAVAHEALVNAHWPRLQDWLREEAQLLNQRRVLQQRAQDWLTNKRDAGYLLSAGAPLQKAREVVDAGVSLSSDEQQFVRQSVDSVESGQRQRRRWIQAIVAASLLVAVVMAGLAWYSAQQTEAARAQTARVEFAGAQRLMEREDSYWDGVNQMATAIEYGLPEDEPGLSGALFGVFDRRRDLLSPSEQIRGLRLGMPGATYRAGAPVSAPIKHQEAVWAVAFSPNGRWVITGSWDHTAGVWDGVSGAPVSAPIKHQGQVLAVAFSPDGRWVVTGSGDNTARVWDAASGAPVSAPIEHQARVNAVAFSPDGRWVVTGSDDYTARVWDAASGAPVSAPIAHQYAVTSVAFSPDGRWVVTAALNIASVWVAASGVAQSPPIAHGNVVTAVAFSPDGRWVVTGSDDSTRVWDAASSTPVSAPIEHQAGVNAVAFGPDGRWVVTGSDDYTARVWDAASGAPVSAAIEHQGPVNAVAFSPDGRWVVTGSDDETARVWDAASGAPVSAPIQHQGSVFAVVFGPDGRWVVTGSYDHTARVWDAEKGAPVSAPIEHQGTINAIAFSPDGRWVVTGSEDKTARIWDAASGAPVSAPIENQGGVSAVAFSPDGRWVVTGSNDATARVWDAASGAPVSAPIEHRGGVRSVAFSPDGRWVVTVSDDNTARVWDAASGSPLSAPIEHEDTVMAVAFSPDGRWVVTGSNDATARVWDAASGAPVSAPIEHRGGVRSVAFSPDGRWVVTGSDDNTARVWDAASGAPVSAPIEHQNGVTAVAFSPDGRWVVTGSSDHTARVWDAASGAPVSAPIEHQSYVLAVAFSPDGRWVVTGSYDKTARVWDAASGAPASAPIEHQGPIDAVAFSADGRWVLTAALDTAGLRVQRQLAKIKPFASAAKLIRSLVDCKVDAQSGSGRCAPRATLDRNDVAAALAANDPVQERWLRYELLGDASALFPINDLAGDPPALRARIGLRPGALKSYWEATGYPALGTGWVLAALAKGTASDHAAAYFWAQRIPRMAAGNQSGAAAVEAGLVHQDLALIETAAAERGYLRLGQTQRRLWYSNAALGTWEDPPSNPAPASVKATPRYRAPEHPSIAVSWPAVHRAYLTDIQDSEMAEVVNAMFDHVPSQSEAAAFRRTLLAKPDNAIAQYALARLLDSGQGGPADPAHALELMRTAAESGFAPAQNFVGYAYLLGMRVGKDLPLSLQWLNKAAESGHPYAKRNLGLLWRDEYDMPERAIPFFREAASAPQPDPGAMSHLGKMLELGWGIERNLAESEQWLRKAADAGLDRAQFELAVRQEAGLYGQSNPAQALRWHVAAATQGHARAAYRVGQMYEEGIGDTANAASAAGWYRIAAMQGHLAAHYALARLILETPTLASSGRPLAIAALKRLIDAAAPEDDKHHDLHWLKSEAQLLARQRKLKL